MPFDRARWIWSAKAAPVNAYVLFKCPFETESAAPLTLRVSADAQYAAFLNGGLAAEGQYADYPEHKVYDEMTLEPAAGKNELTVAAWCSVTDTSVYRQGVPGLIFELTDAEGREVAVSDENTLCAPHPRYKSGPIEMVSPQLGYTFAYDARAAEADFEPAVPVNGSRAFFPRPVAKLVMQPRRAGVLRAQGAFYPFEAETPAEIMQGAPMAFRHPKVLTGRDEYPRFPAEDGARFALPEGDADAAGLFVLIDLYQEDAGFLDLDLAVEQDTTVLIGWGEHTDDLRLRTFVGPRHFAARLTVPAGRTSFLHALKRCGLRYVELFVYAKSFALYYAGIRPTVYPVSGEPAFHTADRLHQRIYDTCRRTLLTCMHEHYEDCPWREQALYSMDSRNQMLCGYYAFGEYAMPRASLELMALSLRKDGLLELCSPARVPITIPSFAAMYLVELQEYQLYSGDSAFARRMLPTARAIAEALLAQAGDGMLIPRWQGQEYWNFYEWQPWLAGQEGHPLDTEALRYDAPMNAFAALALRRLAALEAALGENQGARWLDAANKIGQNAHARFYDPDRGLYWSFANGAGRWGADELTQALMVCADIVPDDCLDGVLTRLTDETLTPVTLAYSVFQFDALMKKPEKYSRWVFDRIARDWGDMLCRDATTFWETLEGARDFSNAGSLCHGWSAVPVYFYFAYALGLKPVEPGFGRYAVDRVESGLYELSGRVRLPDGRILPLE